MKKILKGFVEDLTTGKIQFMNHYLLPLDLKLETIVKVQEVHSYVHEDASMQVYIECRALDSIGAVYNISLDFSPSSAERRDHLIEIFQPGSILMIKGEYGIPKDAPITLSEPQYSFIESESLLEEVKNAFNFNDHRFSQSANRHLNITWVVDDFIQNGVSTQHG